MADRVVYMGTIPSRDRHAIWVVTNGIRDPLAPFLGASLATRWGETSEYSRATALALLTHAAGRGIAISHMDRFVRDVISKLDPNDSWHIPYVEVIAWITSQQAARSR